MQDGYIYLCGRADGDPSRFFSGSVTHLSLFNTVLTPAQIKNLYRAVVLSTFRTFRNQAAAPDLATSAVAAPMAIDLAGGPSVEIAVASGPDSAFNLPAGTQVRPISHHAAPLLANAGMSCLSPPSN
jgi:hypothetical protein